ncbi:hypothetical protein CLOM_g17342 [Closterium sp. NIES-68]|nr:hypothetical protein CLOM_g17342 [Closterium sp. NIES-68]
MGAATPAAEADSQSASGAGAMDFDCAPSASPAPYLPQPAPAFSSPGASHCTPPTAGPAGSSPQGRLPLYARRQARLAGAGESSAELRRTRSLDVERAQVVTVGGTEGGGGSSAGVQGLGWSATGTAAALAAAHGVGVGGEAGGNGEASTARREKGGSASNSRGPPLADSPFVSRLCRSRPPAPSPLSSLAPRRTASMAASLLSPLALPSAPPSLPHAHTPPLPPQPPQPSCAAWDGVGERGGGRDRGARESAVAEAAAAVAAAASSIAAALEHGGAGRGATGQGRAGVKGKAASAGRERERAGGVQGAGWNMVWQAVDGGGEGAGEAAGEGVGEAAIGQSSEGVRLCEDEEEKEEREREEWEREEARKKLLGRGVRQLTRTNSCPPSVHRAQAVDVGSDAALACRKRRRLPADPHGAVPGMHGQPAPDVQPSASTFSAASAPFPAHGPLSLASAATATAAAAAAGGGGGMGGQGPWCKQEREVEEGECGSGIGAEQGMVMERQGSWGGEEAWSGDEREGVRGGSRSTEGKGGGAGVVHVRARRGQATDSHSIAERVRREKISERMSVLQSLVPTCAKVTGKAMILDEIINYVRSLQLQVELLSSKLSALEYDLDYDDLSSHDGLFQLTPEHLVGFPVPAAARAPPEGGEGSGGGVQDEQVVDGGDVAVGGSEGGRVAEWGGVVVKEEQWEEVGMYLRDDGGGGGEQGNGYGACKWEAEESDVVDSGGIVGGEGGSSRGTDGQSEGTGDKGCVMWNGRGAASAANGVYDSTDTCGGARACEWPALFPTDTGADAAMVGDGGVDAWWKHGLDEAAGGAGGSVGGGEVDAEQAAESEGLMDMLLCHMSGGMQHLSLQPLPHTTAPPTNHPSLTPTGPAHPNGL